MNVARINGAFLHFRHVPAEGKPTIVFINSLGTDMRIWDEVIRQLGDQFSFLTFDKRGHGLSELGEAPHSMETYAEDLAALLDHLGIRSATICGLSIGGLIAQCLCKSRPDLIKSLILCGTATRIGTSEMWEGRIEAVRSQGISALADAILANWFTPDFHRNRAGELALCRAMLTRQDSAGYAGACAALRDADFGAQAALIQVPTLCVVGDRDGSTPPQLVEQLARSIPGARFTVIPDAGHIPCVERPASLAGLITDFMSSSEESQP